jgi:hypothetical protein
MFVQLKIIWLFFRVSEVYMNGIEYRIESIKEYQREVEVTS